MQNVNDSWQIGNLYEKFIGRWSSRIARKFLTWLAERVKDREKSRSPAPAYIAYKEWSSKSG